MATHVSRRQLITQNENLEVNRKKVSSDEIPRASKTVSKKGGAGLGHRKALNDITNRTSVHREVSKQKNNVPKEEPDISREGFLHNHKKCIQEQEAARSTFRLELVLPGHDLASRTGKSEATETKTEPGIPTGPLELEELPMSEFSGWFDSSKTWVSPPCSPAYWDSPPSPLAWQFEPMEFRLKEECDPQV